VEPNTKERISGPKGEEVTGEWRKVHKVALQLICLLVKAANQREQNGQGMCHVSDT
jgi:hypothetical protein